MDWNYFSALFLVFFPSCALFCCTAYLWCERWAREDNEKRERLKQAILATFRGRLVICRFRGTDKEAVMYFDDYFTLPYRAGSQWRVS